VRKTRLRILLVLRKGKKAKRGREAAKKLRPRAWSRGTISISKRLQQWASTERVCAEKGQPEGKKGPKKKGGIVDTLFAPIVRVKHLKGTNRTCRGEGAKGALAWDCSQRKPTGE